MMGVIWVILASIGSILLGFSGGVLIIYGGLGLVLLTLTSPILVPALLGVYILDKKPINSNIERLTFWFLVVLVTLGVITSVIWTIIMLIGLLILALPLGLLILIGLVLVVPLHRSKSKLLNITITE